MIRRREKHGLSTSPEYVTWEAMISRCTNPKNIGYAQYGGAGIKVCQKWRESFMAFYNDVGPRPSLGHSIDRIDSRGNYEPGNVRWATRQEQNRSRNQGLLTINGVTRHRWEWAQLSGIPGPVITRRIRQGMSPERAITRPLGIHLPGEPPRRKRKELE